MNRSPQEILLAAADHIEAVGWIQGAAYANSYDIPNSPCCAFGAIGAVVNNDVEYQEARNLLQEDIHRSHGLFTIPHWNDTPGMTADDVIDGLRAAAMNA